MRLRAPVPVIVVALGLSSFLLPLSSSLGAQAAPVAPATRVARAATGDILMSHLRFLADDALEGRAPGTRGGDIAAKYVAAQFERLGLEPAGDDQTYYHHVPIVALNPSPTLIVRGARTDTLRYRDDYVLWSLRDDIAVSVTGNIVFAGYGIVAPEYQWNDYDGLDVKGKIVVVLVNDPGLRDSTIFRGKILTYYGRWTYKIEEAERQGAAGILMVHTTESATYGWPTVVGSWTGEQVRLARAPTSLQVAGWVREEVADRYLFPARDFAKLTERAARRSFKGVTAGPTLSATVRSTLRRSETVNVVGRLPGTGPRAAQAVLIGGHYDHLGIREPVNGDSIYNGAEDNASGTAAVLTAAEAFVTSGVRPGRSILFMAFGAEESGLLGSQAFAARPTLPLHALAAVLNMDVMNLYGTTRDIDALGLDQSTLGGTFRAAAMAEGLRIRVNRDALLKGSFFRSDHFSFARVGVPALSLESGLDYVGHPREWGQQQSDEYTDKRYHQPSDELQPWFTPDGALQQLRVILRTAVVVANAISQPAWLPGSEFRAAGKTRLMKQ